MPDLSQDLIDALADRYRIEREVGAGGMATVYLARDLKHNRQVALKVLKPELAAVVGAERFLTEIETTANLQHPHILPLYDSGQADSFLYYVMPYVEGPTLRDRLDDEKQLPVDEAVRIATALAAALEFAHSHDVVHRDIKPANILFQAGEPVLGDFGIALAVGAGGGARLTETGLSVGTPYYMSPEQATGDQSVGPRSDIYSLGCVLYEMLVGDPPFTGSTAQAVLGQIISGSAATASERRATIPAHVDAVMRKALERVPADRFASAAEMSAALADPAFRHGADATDAGEDASALPWKLATAAAAVAALAGVGWGLTAQGSPGTDASRSIRLAPPAELGTWTGLAVAPDGSFMVHNLLGDPTAEAGDEISRTRALWLQRWDGLPPTEIPGTRGARTVAVSPDGERLAFTTEDGALRTVRLDGGQGVTLHPDVGFTSLAWGTDGHIYGGFATTRSPTVQRVPETGGPPEDVTTAIVGRSHRNPQLLPNGRGLLYRSFPNSLTGAADSVGVLDFQTGEQRILTDGRNAWYSPGGHLVWVRGSQLVTQAMDLETLRLVGSPVAVADRVIGFLAADESGDLLFLEGMANGSAPQLVWLERDGTETVVASFAPGTPFPQDPTPSPDGSRVAFVLEDDNEVLYVVDIQTGLRTRLAEGGRPSWSSDGRYVGFARVDSIDSVWRVRADRSAPPERLTADHVNDDFQLGRWSLAGPLVVGTTTGLAVVEPGDSVAEPIFEAGEPYQDPALSPDGRWVAYTIVEDGDPKVFVRPYPNVGSALYPVSVGFGQDVHWSADGSTLFYEGETEEGRDIFAAEVETAPEFRIVSREPRFPLQRGYGWSEGGWYYTVHPEGERALISRLSSEPPDVTGFVLIQNFDRLVRERLGG